METAKENKSKNKNTQWALCNTNPSSREGSPTFPILSLKCESDASDGLRNEAPETDVRILLKGRPGGSVG